jgi:hypothetical protein
LNSIAFHQRREWRVVPVFFRKLPNPTIRPMEESLPAKTGCNGGDPWRFGG